MGWIGVDLDGTLAFYDGWKGMEHIGEPIKPMVQRVKEWIYCGKDVRIFTARVGNGAEQIKIIEAWCADNIGCVLPVTNIKDFKMIELWDDRSVAVGRNTGDILGMNKNH